MPDRGSPRVMGSRASTDRARWLLEWRRRHLHTKRRSNCRTISQSSPGRPPTHFPALSDGATVGRSVIVSRQAAHPFSGVKRHEHPNKEVLVGTLLDNLVILISSSRSCRLLVPPGSPAAILSGVRRAASRLPVLDTTTGSAIHVRLVNPAQEPALADARPRHRQARPSVARVPRLHKNHQPSDRAARPRAVRPARREPPTAG